MFKTVNASALRVIKQLIHGTIPFVICFILYTKGFNTLTCAAAGGLYGITAGYVYFFIKKEQAGWFVAMLILYAYMISGI